MIINKSLLLVSICSALYGQSNALFAQDNPNVIRGDHGISATGSDAGLLYFRDNNYSGNWNFLCLNDVCSPGENKDGFWERPVSGLIEGNTYTIQAKIQDNATGQFLSDVIDVIFTTDVTDTPDDSDNPDDGDGNNPDDGDGNNPDDGDGNNPDDGNQCDQPDDKPVANGEEYEFGITGDGTVFHNAIPGHSPSFAIIGLQGSGVSLPESGPYDFTDSQGNQYQRYQTQISEFDPDSSYAIEIRLQGNRFNTGQCIFTANLKGGEGIKDSPCYQAPTGNDAPSPEPVKPSTVSVKITNGAAGEARLTAGAAFEDKVGFALYTFLNDTDNQSHCSGDCEVNWPKVIVASAEDLVVGGGATGEFGVIPRTRTVTDACGNSKEVTDYHVTYNKKPLYFYANDNTAADTNGANIPTWQLAQAALIEQLPLVKHPAPALKTAINGLQPRRYGFTIDLEGRQVSWKAGYDPTQFGHLAGLIAQFSNVGGDGSIGAKDPNLQFWCSNNQIQFHKADMPGTLAGPYTTEVPGACYGKYYYFFRYKMRGTVNNEPDTNWVYSALFEYDESQPNDRIDPRTRPTQTYKAANWQRFGHPHSRDRPQDFITFDASPYNFSLFSGLERYLTEFVDGPGRTELNTFASVAPIRLEIMEYGQGNCQGPQYVIGAENAPYPIRSEYNYGQILSFEASFPSSNNAKFGGTAISSQIYNTMQHVTLGAGFQTPTGDPRLNPAGRGSVYLVHSNGCNPVEEHERNARFAQHLITLESDEEVNDFLLGHDHFHGSPQVSGARPGDTGFDGGQAIRDASGAVQVDAGLGSCGSCHTRDGRGTFLVDTPKGKLLPPPVYGSGLLTWIDGAEVGLTWDGSVATVEEQARSALKTDHGLEVSDIGQTVFDRIVTYTETLNVPVRKFSSYSDPAVSAGEVAFMNAGCADCHQPTQKTRSDAPVAFRDLYIRPYTDMKLWEVNGGKFRTPPLWGIGANIEILERLGKPTLFMHDGSANSLEEAIDQHGSVVSGLSAEDKSSIVAFMKTL